MWLYNRKGILSKELILVLFSKIPRRKNIEWRKSLDFLFMGVNFQIILETLLYLFLLAPEK